VSIDPHARKVLDDNGIEIVRAKYAKEIAVTDDLERLIQFGAEKIRLGDVEEWLKGLGQQVVAQHGVSYPPHLWIWNNTNKFRLFISHMTKHKDKATRLKECLSSYAISGFVAHEHIHPTLEWQREIERALYAMDAFLAIHTPRFKSHSWTQQEIGFAFARDVKIISLNVGEDPTGFITKCQALAWGDQTAEKIAQKIEELLASDQLTSAKLRSAKICQQHAIQVGEGAFKGAPVC